MSRRALRATAALSGLLLVLSGCYTGHGRAESRRELLKIGMSPEEVRDELGEPDEVAGMLDPQDSVPVVVWTYAYTTPFTMYIVPTIGLFTVVLCVPSVCYLLGLTWGGSTCRLRVEFGPDLKLRRAVTDLHY